jgi:hypothetical protein
VYAFTHQLAYCSSPYKKSTLPAWTLELSCRTVPFIILMQFAPPSNAPTSRHLRRPNGSTVHLDNARRLSEQKLTGATKEEQLVRPTRPWNAFSAHDSEFGQPFLARTEHVREGERLVPQRWAPLRRPWPWRPWHKALVCVDLGGRLPPTTNVVLPTVLTISRLLYRNKEIPVAT